MSEEIQAQDAEPTRKGRPTLLQLTRAWVHWPTLPELTGQLTAVLPALALIAAYILVFLADTWREPQYTTPIFFGLMVACTLRPLQSALETGIDRIEARCAGLLVLCLIPVLIDPETLYQGMMLYPNAGRMGAAIVLAAVLASILVVRPPPALLALVMLAIAGCAIRVYAVGSWEIHPGVRDMLPLIISANKALLAGDNPYAIHTMQVGSQIPLTYPPLMWLAHLPAVAMDADIRWTFVAADVVVVLGLGIPAIRKSPRGKLVLIGLAAYLFIPDVHWNGMYAEPQVDWAVLALMLGALISRRPLWIGVVLGIGLITRPFNVVIAPMIVVWLVIGFGSRRAFQATVIAGVIAAVGYVPFVLMDSTMFYMGTVDWLLQYGPSHADWFYDMMGFSGMLYESGNAQWQQRAQLLIVASGIGWTIWQVRSTRHFLIVVLFVYAGFVAFNSLLWMSFWISVCLVATAVLATGDDSSEWMQSKRRGWGEQRFALVVEFLAALLVVAAAVTLLVELRRYFSHDGQEVAASALSQEVQPGDTIVDLSGPRLAFMTAPPLLGPDELPEGVELARSPYRHLPWPPDEDRPWYWRSQGRTLKPGNAERVWVVDRYGWRDRYPILTDDVFYQEISAERFGRYELVLLERVPDGGLSRPAHGPIEAELESNPGDVTLSRWDKQRRAAAFDGFPSWAAVEVKRCQIDGNRRMIWAHPVDGHTTRVHLKPPPDATRALISAGIDDRAVVWGHSPVQVSALVDGEVAVELHVPNEPGLRSKGVQLEPGQELSLEVSAENAGLRHLCFDVSYWR